MKKIYFSFLSALVGHSLSAQIVGGASQNQTNLATQTEALDCVTIFSFPVTAGSTGLASNGTHFYTHGVANNLIYKYSLTGALVGTIPSPTSSGGDLDFDGTSLWVVAEQEGNIYKINPENGSVITSFAFPNAPDNSDPNNYGCAYDNGYIWSTDYVAETLVRMDASTGEILDTFNIGRWILPLKIINDGLYGIEFIDQSANGAMQVVQFDKTTGDVIQVFPLCIPYPLGLNWANGHLWGLSTANATVYEFDDTFFLAADQFSLANTFRVFPNPVLDKTTANSRETLDDIAVFDALGNQVYRAKNPGVHAITIDLSFLQSGVYIMKVGANGKVHTQKILKQ